jgi:hypothetical protein
LSLDTPSDVVYNTTFVRRESNARVVSVSVSCYVSFVRARVRISKERQAGGGAVFSLFLAFTFSRSFSLLATRRGFVRSFVRPSVRSFVSARITPSSARARAPSRPSRPRPSPPR